MTQRRDSSSLLIVCCSVYIYRDILPDCQLFRNIRQKITVMGDRVQTICLPRLFYKAVIMLQFYHLWCCSRSSRCRTLHLYRNETVSYSKEIAHQHSRSTTRPCKIFLTSTLITMQHLIVVFHTVCMHVGGPRIWGRWRPAAIEWGV